MSTEAESEPTDTDESTASRYPIQAQDVLPGVEGFDVEDYTEVVLRADRNGLSIQSETERTIDQAERALNHARRKEGHHESVRKAMAEWARGLEEQYTADARASLVYDLTPSERNMGELTGDDETRLRKAEVILQWAEDEYGAAFITGIEQSQYQDLRDEMESIVEESIEKQKRKSFAEELPEECRGWQRREVDVDHVEVAYEAESCGKHEIVAVYRDEDGKTHVEEFRKADWEDADGDPRKIRLNRHVLNVDEPPCERLYDHFGMFDATPVN